jgi:hypothetical protein
MYTVSGMTVFLPAPRILMDLFCASFSTFRLSIMHCYPIDSMDKASAAIKAKIDMSNYSYKASRPTAHVPQSFGDISCAIAALHQFASEFWTPIALSVISKLSSFTLSYGNRASSSFHLKAFVQWIDEVLSEFFLPFGSTDITWHHRATTVLDMINQSHSKFVQMSFYSLRQEQIMLSSSTSNQRSSKVSSTLPSTHHGGGKKDQFDFKHFQELMGGIYCLKFLSSKDCPGSSNMKCGRNSDRLHKVPASPLPKVVADAIVKMYGGLRPGLRQSL